MLAAPGNTVGSQKNRTALENPKGTKTQQKEKQQGPGEVTAQVIRSDPG